MTKVDVVVVGGGANGTGLARDLAKRGLSVVLCEKGDFARGATGASSGMIHGGPRYLLADVETTRHSCADSGYIQKLCPHLLFRVPFLLPVPRNNPYGRMSLTLHDVYFSVYDRYSALKNGIPHARMSVEEMRSVEPGLRGDFLGGVTLDEWGIDPGRLCVLNALDAVAHGATVRTYTEVVRVLQDGTTGRACGVRVRRAGSAATEDIHAHAVVNCGGPWAGEVAARGGGSVQLRPGKGVHLIYEKRLTNFAVICEAVDGRQVFVMPYQNETWIGTTDDDYYGDLDDMWATQDEIAYLVQAIERVIPSIRQQRLIGTRIGVRNTLFGWGVPEDDLSRGYRIIDHGQPSEMAVAAVETGAGAAGASATTPGFFSLTGGKLASYRVQAQDAADAVVRYLREEQLGPSSVREGCQTHLHKLPGGDSLPDEMELARAYGISPLAARRLIGRHGSLAPQVLQVGRERPDGFAVVCPCEPTLLCEVVYCMRHEMVVRLGDLMTRCRIGMGACQGATCALRAAQVFAQERGLDPTDERDALMDLLTRRWRTARPVLTGAQLAQAEMLMTQYTGLWQLPTLRPFT